ncbi:MAG TPA: hypothetical protein VGD67_04385 [Pseudonocardiaceae bacterium]
MPNVTYDPILAVQELSRFRLVSPPAPPRPGTALVLETQAGTPVVVWPGQVVPDARLGNYKRAFVISTERYAVQLEELLPSVDPAFSFHCTLTFHCAVRDPGLVAFREVRDVAGVMRVPLVRLMREVTRRFDIERLNDTEIALDAALRSHTGDAALAAGEYLVELAGADGYHDATRKIRLDDLRRRAMHSVVTAGDAAVRAEWLANQEGEAIDLIRFDANVEALKVEQALKAASIQNGVEYDDFDTRDLRQRLLGQALGERVGLEDGDSGRRGSRRRRIAGQLEAAGDGLKETEQPQSRVRWKAERMDASPKAASPGAPEPAERGEQPPRREEPVRLKRGRPAPADPDAGGE